LRAIAVFSVIIYHAKIFLFGSLLFKGGFIGVDIFFIISGYLITTLILKEISNQNFSFRNFYERRARRILPALFIVIIFISIISFFILLPLAIVDFEKSILSIISFSSNFYFYFTENKYGAESSLLKPLLHTWSLSVEEQFYILFPIFLFFSIKFFKKNYVYVIFLSFLTSLFFAEYFSKSNPYLNFYILPSRWFELTAGSLLAYFKQSTTQGEKSHAKLYQICPSLGIAIILYSLLFFDFTKISHPSVITLIPLLGVSLIIWFSKKGELITRVLSNKILVFFGLISYSLYLWHYPIFALLRYINVFNNFFPIKLLGIILSIILSILTFYFIEKPFRNKNLIKSQNFFFYIFAIIIILLISYFGIIRFIELRIKKTENIFYEKIEGDVSENQYNRTKDAKKNIVLIGDSHMRTLKYYLNEESIKSNYNFYVFPTNFYLPDFELIDRKTKKNNKDYANYTIINAHIDNYLRDNKNLIIVWHQRWSLYLHETFFDNQEGFKENDTDPFWCCYFTPLNIQNSTLEERQKYISESIKSSIKNILEQGHILLLVYPVPEMGFDVPRTVRGQMQKNLKKFTSYKNYTPIVSGSYNVYKERHKIIFKILDDIQSPNVYRIYPDKFFCNTSIISRCVGNNSEQLFYYDNNHLSIAGSKFIVDEISKTIEKIVPNK